jgi:hypothetical protein
MANLLKKIEENNHWANPMGNLMDSPRDSPFLVGFTF